MNSARLDAQLSSVRFNQLCVLEKKKRVSVLCPPDSEALFLCNLLKQEQQHQ